MRNPVFVWFAVAAAPGLTGCLRTTTQQSAHSAAILQNAEGTSAIVIRGYTKDLVGIRAANHDVKLRVDRDSALANERVLFVEYPAPTNDPAGRDVPLTPRREIGVPQPR